MPAPKIKATTSEAKEKTPHTNGSAAPVSGEKKATSEVVLLAGGKPDKQAHEREQEKIKQEVDGLQVKLVRWLSELMSFTVPTRNPPLYQSAVRDKINLATQSSAGNERRNELKSELDTLRDQQSSRKLNRGKLLEQVKSLQENIQKKVHHSTVVSYHQSKLSICSYLTR